MTAGPGVPWAGAGEARGGLVEALDVAPGVAECEDAGRAVEWLRFPVAKVV